MWTWYGTGDALPNKGDWVDPNDAGLWAPDVREITSGHYVLYYSVKPKSVRIVHIVNEYVRLMMHHCMLSRLIAALLLPRAPHRPVPSRLRAAHSFATTVKAV